MKISFSGVASVIAVAIAILGVVFGHGGSPVAGNTTQSFWDSALGYKVNGTTIINSSKQLILGTNGTAVSGVVYGTCKAVAYSNTITASSTAQIDCSSDGTPSGTISGLTASQLIDGWATTTISSLSQGVSIIGSHASTTAGIITLRLANGTGATFTWSAAASTTFAYYAIR